MGILDLLAREDRRGLTIPGSFGERVLPNGSVAWKVAPLFRPNVREVGACLSGTLRAWPSLVRAPVWGTGSRRFKSCRADHEHGKIYISGCLLRSMTLNEPAKAFFTS